LRTRRFISRRLVSCQSSDTRRRPVHMFMDAFVPRFWTLSSSASLRLNKLSPKCYPSVRPRVFRHSRSLLSCHAIHYVPNDKSIPTFIGSTVCSTLHSRFPNQTIPHHKATVFYRLASQLLQPCKVAPGNATPQNASAEHNLHVGVLVAYARKGDHTFSLTELSRVRNTGVVHSEVPSSNSRRTSVQKGTIRLKQLACSAQENRHDTAPRNAFTAQYRILAYLRFKGQHAAWRPPLRPLSHGSAAPIIWGTRMASLARRSGM
jgi:hypothetical protein